MSEKQDRPPGQADGTQSPDNGDDDPFLTIDEVSRYISVPRATLYSWRSRRRGFGPPAIKMGGILRYRKSDVDAWIDKHREPNTDDGWAKHEDVSRRGRSTPPEEPGASLSRKSGPRQN